MDINSCVPIKKGSQSIFKSAEHGCEHIGININHHTIRHFKVDKGIIPKNSPEKKCDYLLLNDTDRRAYYIELKGSDIEEAIQQIENSIKLLHGGIKSFTIYPRIIYFTGTHDTRGSKALRWKAKYNNRAIIYSRRYKENIS